MPTVPSFADVVAAGVLPIAIGAGLVTTFMNPNSESTSSPPRRNRHDNPWSDRARAGSTPTSIPYTENRRAQLKKIAEDTLRAMQAGTYTYKGIAYDLAKPISEARDKTEYLAPDCSIASWASTKARQRKNGGGGPPAHVSVLQISTLDAARLLESVYQHSEYLRGRTGVLNFASATLPGGGFKNGAEAQEESIARASTLYPTLDTDEAGKFYTLHRDMQRKKSTQPFYTHAIIYSPNVRVFRDDDGVWTYPFSVDVLSCAAVNAGEVRKGMQGPAITGLEVEIEREMSERMGRILYVFEQRGVRNLVLGTFGTGVFRNNIALVARLWAHLLILPEARFKHSFDRIIFAITGDETFAEFQSAFEAWGQKRQTPRGNASSSGSLMQF